MYNYYLPVFVALKLHDDCSRFAGVAVTGRSVRSMHLAWVSGIFCEELSDLHNAASVSAHVSARGQLRKKERKKVYLDPNIHYR